MWLSWVALFVLAFGSISEARAEAAPSATAQHLQVELVVPPQQLAAGSSFTAGLHFTLEKGWHIYWVNAGDVGEAPDAKWSLPQGVTADQFLFPAPKRLPYGPLMDFGYEDSVTFPVPMHVAADAKPGPATLHADLRWLVCRETCFPGKGSVAIARTIVPSGTAPQIDAHAKGIIDAGLASLPKPLPAGASAVFAPEGKGLTLAVLTGVSVESAQFYPLEQSIIANVPPQPAAPLAKGVRLTLVRDSGATAQPAELKGVVVLPGGAAYSITAVPGKIPAVVAAKSAPADTGGLLEALGFAFLGGIILNLMPCVFPVLFIKGLALVQASREERQVMRAHGWVYTLGILVSFWAVVAVLLVLRGAGHQLGWGFQFQSPVFLAVIAMLLFFVSLSLAGQFEMGLSLTSKGGELAQKQGYAGSFFTGVLAMVVATPCVAPLMGVAVGYALAHSGLVSFAVFTMLGLGLAVPGLLLAYNPGWTRLLPKPGAWMETLKQLVSIPIFATVIWFVWLFAQAVGSTALLGLLVAFLILAIAGGVLGKWPGKRAAAVWATVLVALAIAVPVYAAHVFGTDGPGGTQTAQGTGNDWKPFTPDAVAKYRAEGKPVLVDFTASWCLSCQVNERVVLDRADVQDRLRKSGVVLIRADWTRHDAAIGAALATLGRSAIPAYALYPADPNAQPHMLPEVLTPVAVYSALDALGKTTQASAGQ